MRLKKKAKPIPPRPRRGWTVHNAKGERRGVVARVLHSRGLENHAQWVSDQWGHTVTDTFRWEDAPEGTYREPKVKSKNAGANGIDRSNGRGSRQSRDAGSLPAASTITTAECDERRTTIVRNPNEEE